jgi:hypothetical protein
MDGYFLQECFGTIIPTRLRGGNYNKIVDGRKTIIPTRLRGGNYNKIVDGRKTIIPTRLRGGD